MNAELRRLLRWLRRAQPPAGPLLRALLSAVIATATNVGLLVGALALLVESANRPGLRAVAGVLIVIELLAFLRSPLRFAERLSSHRLGFAAVARWRRWLVTNVGRWAFARWRTYASGDLLERSLRDTDELQDLWLRFVIPCAGAVTTAALGDLVIGLLPPHGRWWSYALFLALVQLAGLLGLFANVAPLIRADRQLRTMRGAYQATLVELSAVAPELLLLGRGAFVDQRCQSSVRALHQAERDLERRRRLTSALPIVVTLGAVALLGADHPRTSPTWMVVVALLAIATFEMLAAVRLALDTAVAVNAAAERLEQLEEPPSTATQPWPVDTTILATHVTIVEGAAAILTDGSLTLSPGQRVAITGRSGSGKSTLLRTLGALDTPESGGLLIGDVAVDDIDEDQLRQHLVYVPSEPGLTRGYAFDVVRLGRTSVRDVRRDLAALGINAERETRWEELSRGERERVALVRATVTSPVIYLLDEPTGGLGADETRVALAFLADTGASVLVATHDPLVLAWCHDVLELREGQLQPL